MRDWTRIDSVFIQRFAHELRHLSVIINNAVCRESWLPCDTVSHLKLKFVGALFAEKFWNNYGISIK